MMEHISFHPMMPVLPMFQQNILDQEIRESTISELKLKQTSGVSNRLVSFLK